MLSEFAERICCPSCHSTIQWNENALSCAKCSREHPYLRGRPILVNESVWQSTGGRALLSSAENLGPAPSRQPAEHRSEQNVEQIFFDEMFQQFNRKDPHASFLAEMVAEMVSEIPVHARVLDVGAGECKYARLLAHTKYVSTDLVFSSDKHDFSGLDVISDASSIPFLDETFDTVLNFVTMEHVPDPLQVVAEMSRVLRPGGKLYAIIPLVRPEHLVPYDFHRFTRYGIERLLGDAGFVVDRSEGSNGSLWTAVHYLNQIAKSHPLQKFGRRSIKGMLLNRMWYLGLRPLLAYARMTDRWYGDEFPMYFWVRATKQRSATTN